MEKQCRRGVKRKKIDESYFDEDHIEKENEETEKLQRVAEILKEAKMKNAPDFPTALSVAMQKVSDIALLTDVLQLACDIGHLSDLTFDWNSAGINATTGEMAVSLAHFPTEVAKLCLKKEPVVLAPPVKRCPFCKRKLSEMKWKKQVTVYCPNGTRKAIVLRLYSRNCRSSVKPFYADCKSTGQRQYYSYQSVQYVQVTKEAFWDKQLAEFYVSLVYVFK